MTVHVRIVKEGAQGETPTDIANELVTFEPQTLNPKPQTLNPKP